MTKIEILNINPPLNHPTMKMKYILAAIGIPALALATFFVSRWQKEEFSPIPEKRMWIDGRDVKAGAIVRWPQKGVATITSPKFTIAFEGESWSEISLIRSQYKVDGRYGGIFNSPDSEPFIDDMGNGVKYAYSARKREAVITYKNLSFIYCDYRNTLRAAGKEYSTAQAPVQLWVSKQGTIKRL